MPHPTDRNKVQSVTKVISILEELAHHDGRMKLTALSTSLDMPVSTVSRLLNSLMDMGYVNKDEKTGEYILGLRLLSLASVVLRQLNLRQIAYPFLEQLRNQTQETANLVMLDTDEVMYVEKAESRQPIRAFSMIGRRAPVHATGAGKVLLADMRMDEILPILRKHGLREMTPKTITDYDQFMEELNRIRVAGYALDNEECEPGVACIAVPVRNHEGRTVASISISGPRDRLSPRRMQELVPTVKHIGRDLSHKLGYVEGLGQQQTEHLP